MMKFLNMDILFVQVQLLYRLENKTVRNIFYTNIMHVEASTCVKVSTFGRKMEGETESQSPINEVTSFVFSWKIGYT